MTTPTNNQTWNLIYELQDETNTLIESIQNRMTWLGEYEQGQTCSNSPEVVQTCRNLVVGAIDKLGFLEKSSGGLDSIITTKKGYQFRQTGKCRRRDNIKVISPQKPEQSRPINFLDDPLGYIKLEEGYQCQLCDYSHKKCNSIQQHCLAHFPPKYNCSECGDAFHLKTAKNDHYLLECLSCFKKIKKGSKSSHNCRKLK